MLLAGLRNQHGWTQRQAVDRAWPTYEKPGDRLRLISRWEGGGDQPTPGLLGEYLNAVAKDPDQFFVAWEMAGYPVLAVKGARTDIRKRLDELRSVAGKIRAQVRDGAQLVGGQLAEGFSLIGEGLSQTGRKLDETKESVSDLRRQIQDRFRLEDVDLSPYDLPVLEKWIDSCQLVVAAWEARNRAREDAQIVFWGLFEFVPALDAVPPLPPMRIAVAFFMNYLGWATIDFVLSAADPVGGGLVAILVPDRVKAILKHLPKKIDGSLSELQIIRASYGTSHLGLRNKQGGVILNFSPQQIGDLAVELTVLKDQMVELQSKWFETEGLP